MEQINKITSIIAHIDHGKTTLIDSLIASEGYFSKSLAGELRYLDSRKDEQERGDTLKLTPIKLKNGHIIIDTPGHVDFESLIFSSSILSDNHLVMIDINEGIMPRTYSLVKFIEKSRAILVLNKVDKCTDFDSVNLRLHQINGLIGEEVFEWSKNNVILSSAILGAGICHSTFKYSKKNTLSMAFKAFQALDDKIANKEAESIILKYNIKYPNRKSIFSTVMPLADTVFETIDTLYENSRVSDLISKAGSLGIGEPEPPLISENKLSVKCNFYSITCEEIPKVLGITVYGLLNTKNVYTKDNILFVTKIFSGKISRGDTLVYTSNELSKKVILEHIYNFSIDTFEEIESTEGPTLVCLQGDFLKDSVISTIPVGFHLENFLTPFFRSKLILRNFSQLDEIKNTIRVMSFVEKNLKVKLNKFGELEFKCSGNVQFEKICFDLSLAGYDFSIKEPEKEFREFSRISKKHRYTDEFVDIEIVIGPIQEFNKKNRLAEECVGEIDFDEDAMFCRDQNNIYLIKSSENSHIIESVLDIFTDSGPLIKEKIINTFICINTIREDDSKFFNTLKNELSYIYLQSDPSICLLFFSLKFSFSQEYLGVIYAVLQKHFYLMENEDYNDDADFIVLKCKIPQFTLNDLIDDVRVKSKGTAYLEVKDDGYIPEGDYHQMIDDLRREKGLYIDEKIVENPEKQRTFRK